MSGLKVCFCQDVHPIESKVQISGDRASSTFREKVYEIVLWEMMGPLGVLKIIENDK